MPHGKIKPKREIIRIYVIQENDTVKNKTSIVYEDTKSKVSSQIKAQREKHGKKKKTKKKNATNGPSQAIAQSTIKVEEQKNGDIKDNKSTSQFSMGRKAIKMPKINRCQDSEALA